MNNKVFGRLLAGGIGAKDGLKASHKFVVI